MPRHDNPERPRLQVVGDADFTLDLDEDQRKIVMDQRELTGLAFKHLQAPLQYCLPREDKPLPPDAQEEYHNSDDKRLWIDDLRKQRLNGLLVMPQGVVEVRFQAPDDTLAQCFFAACAKLGIQTRYALGRSSRKFAQSILFKLREGEAEKLDDGYSAFKPNAFALDGDRRRVIIKHFSPGKNARTIFTTAPGSLLWHANGSSYDMVRWWSEDGAGDAKRWATEPQVADFFALVRASTYAAILNVIKATIWESTPARWSFSEWLARIVIAGEGVNSNIVFAKASRAVISTHKHAKDLIELIGEAKGLDSDKIAECCDRFEFARKRLEQDSSRHDIAGWGIIREWFGGEAHDALRTMLTVGADSSLIEKFAERYLLIEGESTFIDRQAHREGWPRFEFSKDELALTHAPDQIVTKKKPVKAFPIFVESKLRQSVTGMEMYPDSDPGSVLRVNRQGALIANDDYAPEDSRLIFNSWAGLYVKPAKTIESALKAECIDKLDHMLSLVTKNHAGRMDWIKAHFGWTLKFPGKKQQVALVCTGDQSTGKTFLCKDFAEAVFGRYAGKGSMKAFEGQFYIPNYINKLWVTHDEVTAKEEILNTIKDLIRSTTISGEFKNQNPTTHTTYARLAFTSNEMNPGLAKGFDRGIFQVTSITAASEGLMPREFEERMNKTSKPFYAGFYDFLQRQEVREAYVRMLMDCAPDTLAQVEELEHSAVRDSDGAAAQLTPVQLVAKEILENGTIHGGFDIAMPFRVPHLAFRVKRAVKEIGLHQQVLPDAVRDLYYQAGLLGDLSSGEYLFKYKIGGLQRIFSEFLGGIPMRSHWLIEPNDDMPNDWHEGDAMEPWKGRGK